MLEAGFGQQDSSAFDQSRRARASCSVRPLPPAGARRIFEGMCDPVHSPTAGGVRVHTCDRLSHVSEPVAAGPGSAVGIFWGDGPRTKLVRTPDQSLIRRFGHRGFPPSGTACSRARRDLLLANQGATRDIQRPRPPPNPVGAGRGGSREAPLHPGYPCSRAPFARRQSVICVTGDGRGQGRRRRGVACIFLAATPHPHDWRDPPQ